MAELTDAKRDGLIDRVGLVSTRLTNTVAGPGRDSTKRELKRLIRLLWLDGQRDPDEPPATPDSAASRPNMNEQWPRLAE